VDGPEKLYPATRIVKPEDWGNKAEAVTDEAGQKAVVL
jgi:hypothetical protein